MESCSFQLAPAVASGNVQQQAQPLHQMTVFARNLVKFPEIENI